MNLIQALLGYVYFVFKGKYTFTIYIEYLTHHLEIAVKLSVATAFYLPCGSWHKMKYWCIIFYTVNNWYCCSMHSKWYKPSTYGCSLDQVIALFGLTFGKISKERKTGERVWWKDGVSLNINVQLHMSLYWLLRCLEVPGLGEPRPTHSTTLMSVFLPGVSCFSHRTSDRMCISSRMGILAEPHLFSKIKYTIWKQWLILLFLCI